MLLWRRNPEHLWRWYWCSQRRPNI